WMIIWLAVAMGVAALVERRLERSQAVVRQSLSDEPSLSLYSFEGLTVGGGVGWRIHPKQREALLLPIAIGVLALVSITPFFNPQRRSIALVGDAVLVAAI